MKNSNKNKAYFLYVVFQKKIYIYIYIYIGKQSLSCAMHNSYSSLTSSIPFTFSLSSHTITLTLSGLFFSNRFLPICLSSLFSFLFPFPSVTQFSEFWAIFSFFSKQFLAWWIPIWTTAEVHSFSHIKVQQKEKKKKKKEKKKMNKVKDENLPT